MLFIQHKTSISRFLLTTAALCLYAINASAEEQSQKVELPTLPNWYQVEVILFDQKSILGDEQPPKDISLEFPNNWIELRSSYPRVGIMRRPLFDRLSESSLSKPSQESLSKRIYTNLGIQHIHYINEYNDELNLVPEATIPYQNNEDLTAQQPDIEASLESELISDNENTVETELFAAITPVYEQPFLVLDKIDRDLNDTARALNRRNYNVHFHQAWRFQITSKEESEWILLKAGDQQLGRYSIEGALRLYKSRFLHFETDLWKIIFANDSELKVNLPEIPQKGLSSEEIILQKTIKFSNRFSALSRDPNGVSSLADEALSGYNLRSIALTDDASQKNLATDADKNQDNNYPVSAIWPIQQSKRIQEGEVYYIDHPQMGALVTIKPYEPMPINFPTNTQQDIENSLLEASN